MTPEELKEIEERCNKATPGPWQTLPPDDTTPLWYISRKPGEAEGFYISCLFNGKDDALFVAHSREDIPALLSYIKELESRISEPERRCSLRTLADGMKKLCPDLVEELIKRVNEYNKKEDEKFSEILTWLKGKEDESSSS
jgi:hypothetical protein